MKKLSFRNIALLTGLFLLNTSAFAQQAAEQTKPKLFQVPKMFFDPVTYIWLLLAFILVVTILVLSHTVNQLTKVINGPAEEALTPQSAVRERVQSESLWHKLMVAMTKSVPVEKEKDVMLDHNYDGIQELDNQLPPWWKYGFYVTIVFAFIYLTVYHVSGTAKLQTAEYNDEIAKADAEKLARMEHNANYVTEENVTLLSEAAAITEGHDLFVKNCASCHGEKGQGNVGPNLTDEFWIHGGGIKNIFKTITEGVPSKGMISWKSQFAPKKIQELASFIMTLEGTKPEGAKEPQGEKWVAAVTQDSSKTASDTTAAANVVAAK